MGFAVRSPKSPFVFLAALGAVALSLCGCAPKFNFSKVTESSASIEGEVWVTSPDQDGTKISYAAESSVTISGTCDEPGWTVTVSGDASGSTTCQGDDTWSLGLDFSSATDGTVSISVQESNGSERSEAVTRAFTKDTAYCAAHSSDTPYAGGSGTSVDPYLICSTAQLMNLSNTSGDWSDDFQLRNDIGLTGQTWTTVNGSGEGAFDGDGFTIMNFSMTGLPDGSVNVGLFYNEVIKNLGAVNADLVDAGNSSGVLCEAYCTITNSYSTGTITATGYHVGGLMGDSYGSGITDSWSSVTLSGSGWTYGGLLGHNYGGTISGSYFTGSVTATDRAGGLVGQNDSSATDGTITDSYSTGSVSISSSGGRGGGLVAVNYCSGCMISDSFSTGAVTGVSGAVLGGLDAEQDTGAGSSDSYWDITTSGQASSPDGAGLTDTEMQAQTNFTGFDFTTPVWTWKSYLSPYPVLDWQ